MTPPNFGSGGGSCWPLMLVVALGEPKVPVTCCAVAGAAASASKTPATEAREIATCFTGLDSLPLRIVVAALQTL